MNKKIRKLLIQYFFITVGSFLYGIGTALFSDPNNLAPGGFTGIAIALNRIVPFGTGAWFMVLNIPVLILGTWKFGLHFIVSTLYATGLISAVTDILARFAVVFAVNDKVLAAFFGGALTAIGMGLIFMQGGTSGGSDIIIKILRLRYPHVKTGGILFATDLVVIFFATLVMKDVPAGLYSIISVFVSGLVLDAVLYGRDEAKVLYIISDEYKAIAERLLKELDVGVTYVYGQGAYSKTYKRVILCVVKKRVSPLAEQIVREEDPKAFLIVSSAMEIFGEGYKSYFEEKV
ncbi:YitT family protein [Butyrivibrio sp. MC2013]|uniref:YitT family protein n=1 Tax=Butyrivibrio sp. MC2013 TaxID=1280686 RepID=UPI00042571EC|nr:YitT family protein [Butyrivibrio sp. MC2013]